MSDLEQLPSAVLSVIRAVNAHDGAAFLKCFAPHGFVTENARTFNGHEGIRGWVEAELTAQRVKIEVAGLVSAGPSPTIEAYFTGEDTYRACRIRFVIYEPLIQSMKITPWTLDAGLAA